MELPGLMELPDAPAVVLSGRQRLFRPEGMGEGRAESLAQVACLLGTTEDDLTALSFVGREGRTWVFMSLSAQTGRTAPLNPSGQVITRIAMGYPIAIRGPFLVAGPCDELAAKPLADTIVD